MVLYYDYPLLATIFVVEKEKQEKKILINAHTDTQFVILLEESFSSSTLITRFSVTSCVRKKTAVSNYFQFN